MDPVSIVGLVVTASQLTQLCIKAANGLKELQSTQSKADNTLKVIQRQCSTLSASLERIKNWARNSGVRSSTQRYVDSLQEALANLTPSIELLVSDVEKILKNKTKSGGLWSVIWRAQFLWSYVDLKIHLEEIQWQAMFVGMLVASMSL